MKPIKDAAERVGATAAYLAAAVLLVETTVANTGLLQGEYAQVIAIPVVALVLNIIKVIAAMYTGDKGTASLAREEVPTDDVVVETVPETDEEF